jgi:putative RNA 2'-phosphotransferase
MHSAKVKWQTIKWRTLSMGHTQQLKRLAKFLSYILGCRPDEFGLVLDAEGFIKIKALLQALSEEGGWRHIRRSHLSELTLSLPDCPLEIVGQEIRARDRCRLSIPAPDTAPPKLLYTNVRQKAYAHILEKGISAQREPLLLCSHKQMADRIGRRRDRNAVQLTIQTREALSRGVALVPCGEGLFQADQLPTGCFSGPPLPKPAPVKPTSRPEPPSEPQTPGSFFIDLEAKETQKRKRHAKRKDQDWKRERRRRQRGPNGKWP